MRIALKKQLLESEACLKQSKKKEEKKHETLCSFIIIFSLGSKAYLLDSFVFTYILPISLGLFLCVFIFI